MSTRKRGRTGGSGIGYSHEFLQRTAHILVQSGHSPRKLLQEFRAICGVLKEPKGVWNPTQLAHLADIPHVIAYWHADPDFVDEKGRPAPLPLSSHERSLTALIARALPHERPLEVVHSLIRVRGIRRRGRFYLPNGRQLVFQKQQRASARIHGLSSLLGILRTIDHNVSRSPQFALLERTAVNPHFPVRDLARFHTRLKQRATEFLWGADGAMRDREADSRSGPTIRLGVGVFAFEDPPLTDRAVVQKRKPNGPKGQRRRGSAPRRHRVRR